METILIGGSRVEPKLAVLKPIADAGRHRGIDDQYRILGPFVLGILAGLLLALKTSNLLYLLPLLAWLCASMPAGARMRWLGRMGLGLLPVAASSYAYAWWITGNPLFPFYNAVFKSPYYPAENFRDLKWMAGVSWRSLWDLAFRTDAYGQFFPGAAGLSVLATLPALAIDMRSRPCRRLTARRTAAQNTRNWMLSCGLSPGFSRLLPWSSLMLQLRCLPLPLTPANGFSWRRQMSP